MICILIVIVICNDENHSPSYRTIASATTRKGENCSYYFSA